MKTARNAVACRTAFGGRTAWKRWAACCVMSAVLGLSGCEKNGNGAAQDADPQVSATLQRLTQELHHAMVGRKINRDFDEFVATQKVEVPPPPPGKKYAINEKWQVVLVNQ